MYYCDLVGTKKCQLEHLLLVHTDMVGASLVSRFPILFMLQVYIELLLLSKLMISAVRTTNH